jgi:putative transposase
MSRPNRYAPGGMVFHVLNRGVGRRTLFETDSDYAAFEKVLAETLRIRPMRICAYCLMPNHWHFVLWPEKDGDLPAFMQQLTNTHAKRWKHQRRELGEGHLYQGRYKSFPVQTADYFYQAVRYVERNALRSNLVTRAESWPWSSLRHWSRNGGVNDQSLKLSNLICSWPLPRPNDWPNLVNEPQTEAELETMRRCANRGCPMGDLDWIEATVKQLGIESTQRVRGRPKNAG